MEIRNVRFELKMECHRIDLPAARSWVRLHSAGFHEAFPPRQVNNIYFDTLGLDTFNDHIEGIPERRKLRFRWYGEDLGSARGQLEIKEKDERVGWKIIQPVQPCLDLRKCDWVEIRRDLLRGLRQEGDGLFEEMLQVTRPVVINCYQREYYVSADDRVRLTLDYDQQAFDQWVSARPNLAFRLPAMDSVFIELKSEVKNSRYLADVLAEFPLRIQRHSKYTAALDPLLER
jgi:hypothetical protein